MTMATLTHDTTKHECISTRPNRYTILVSICMKNAYGHVLNGVISIFLQKDKYMVWQFIINDISHILQNSPKFSVSGCKSG